MLEWLKRHAWKACSRQKRLGGSNPPHSAGAGMRTLGFVIAKRFSLKLIEIGDKLSAVIISIFENTVRS